MHSSSSPVATRSGSFTKTHAKDRRDKAFTEISGRMNIVSRSEQNFCNLKKIAEEEINAGKLDSNKNLSSRRHSVVSKYASPKVERKATPANERRSEVEKKTTDSRRPVLEGIAVPTREHLLKTGTTPNNGKSTGKKASDGSYLGSSSAKTTSNSKKFSARRSTNGDLKLKSSLLIKPPSVSQSLEISITKELVEKIPKSSLNSAAYWLEQVKLAEAVQKHAVSLGFFRLAVECDAEPLQLLQEELVSYKRRYTLCSDGISQVLSCYGITEAGQTQPGGTLLGSRTETLDSLLVSEHISQSKVCKSEPSSPTYRRNPEDKLVHDTTENLYEKREFQQKQNNSVPFEHLLSTFSKEDNGSDISVCITNPSEVQEVKIVAPDEEIEPLPQNAGKLCDSSTAKVEAREECKSSMQSEAPKASSMRRASNACVITPRRNPKRECSLRVSIPKTEPKVETPKGRTVKKDVKSSQKATHRFYLV